MREWRELAACKGKADESYAVGDPFFPNGDAAKPGREAVDTCAACPVHTLCLRDALDAERGLPAKSRYGYYGRTTPEQRARLDPTRKRRPRLPKDAAALRRLIDQGLSDDEIADKTGATPREVAASRAMMTRHITNDDRMDLWHQGYTDQQIAVTLGVDHRTINKWRERRGLAMNGATA